MEASTRDQLRLLAIFHYVLAGLSALFAFFPAIYLVMGVAFLRGGDWMKGPGEPPPPFVGWMMIAFGTAMMLFAFGYVALLILAGRFIQAQRHWTFCIVVAALSCAFFPFGTVLGVFTIIVLSRQEVKDAFSTRSSPAPRAAPTS